MVQLFDREMVLNAGGLRIASRSEKGEVKPILRAQFKITRSLKKDPNTADITIYNLNNAHRSLLQEKDIPTILQAGYSDNISQIFSGVLQFGSSIKQGTDWLTTIQSSDGGDKYKTARINTSRKGPVKIATLLQIAGEALGLNLGNLLEKVKQGTLRAALQEMTEGVVLSGKAEQVFTKIAQQMGYSWSIQDGQIQVLAPNETIATADDDVILLSATGGLGKNKGKSTGLIGSPEPGDKGFVMARSLLQPGLLPGRRVKIESREIDGFFKIEKVVFTGDTWGSDWYSDIEVKPL